MIGGLNYAFYARGSASLHGTLNDPTLSLIDAFGNEVAFNDDANGTTDSFFEYRPADSGAYWLLVEGFGTGTYDVLAGAGRGDNAANYIVGTDSSDNVNGLGGNDIIVGGRGLDRLMGGNGSDTINGGGGGDLMIGGAGNDRYFVDNPNDRVVEVAGEGTDTMFVSASDALIEMAANVENLTLLGTATSVSVEGNELANVIRGNDLGTDPDGYLAGNGGNDWIYGGAASDRIYGDLGDDRLVGGAGADLFIFIAGSDPTQSVIGDRDTVYAFETGVDQLAIGFDGASLAYIGGANFTGTAGEVRYDGNSVTGDADGDGVADFEIVISNHAPLTATDFTDWNLPLLT